MNTATIIPERLAIVMDLPLLSGGHAPPNGTAEFCIMEAVAYVAGEPHSDHPICSSPIIASFLRSWNDSLNDDDRNRLLKPLIPKLVGTSATQAVEDRRAWMIVDWLVREFTPPWLRLIKLDTEADALVSVAEINSVERVESAMRAINAAKEKSAAALDAALDAAGDAALDAAWAAARAAAWDAAWAAAWDAAWAAARAAARAAAWDAASKKLRPTVEQLQTSALALVERLCEAK